MSYLNVAEVETAAANLAAAYPSLCQLIALPNTTFGGRTCHALRLGGGAPGSRDCVMVIGGVHAREWGSCEIAINFASDLLEAYANNTSLAYGGKSFTAAQIQSLLNGLHLLVFPLVNPDGRDFSQTTVALWRRNRNPANSGGNPSCIGVDVNRNFDFLFDFNAAFAAGSNVSDFERSVQHPAGLLRPLGVLRGGEPERPVAARHQPAHALVHRPPQRPGGHPLQLGRRPEPVGEPVDELPESRVQRASRSRRRRGVQGIHPGD
jgi:hypothetical protein